jgi:hypothetical protein
MRYGGEVLEGVLAIIFSLSSNTFLPPMVGSSRLSGSSQDTVDFPVSFSTSLFF